ncbi:MAG: tetratricopeptide repeat protein, partial [Burkholderiaceae bacterium]
MSPNAPKDSVSGWAAGDSSTQKCWTSSVSFGAGLAYNFAFNIRGNEMKTGFRLIGAFAFSAFVLLSNLPGNARAQDIATLQLRAEKGDAQSQSQLGYRYSAGEGVTQDFQKAVFWYRKAAEQGRPVAQYNLGNKYRYGEGVPKDFKQARF